jgi:biofilm PGA synthesis N-glycosyltransferase PgaC
MHDFFLYLIAFANVFTMIHLALYVTGANLYDIAQFRKNARSKKALVSKKTKRQPRQPLVSVVMSAHNEEVGITRTLDSIRASTYKNIEIIVVDDGSKDQTAAVVRNYIKHLPHFHTTHYLARYNRSSTLRRRYVHATIDHKRIVLVTQANRGKGAGINNGIENYAKGQFIMTLDADSLLDSRAIENAVAHFKDKTVVGVAANVRVMGGNNWLSLLQRFEHMIGYRSKKFFTMTGTEFIVGGVASTYRRSTLKKVGYYDTDTLTEDIGLSLKIVAKLGNRKKRIIYASDVLAMTEGVQTYRQLIRQRYRWKMGMLQNLYKYRSLLFSSNSSKYGRGLTLYRLPVAVFSELLLLISPIILGYIIYLSIAMQSFGILFGAYLTITAYVLWNVWPDEYYTLRQKLRMSVFSIFMYIIFYMMDIVQLLAIFKCIFNYRSIIEGVKGHATWVSPTRAGQAATQAVA